MSYRSMTRRSLSCIVLILSVLLLLNGCSHRAVHGTSHGQKPKNINATGQTTGQLTSLDDLASEDAGHSSNPLDLGSNDFGSFSPEDGVLSQELMTEGSPGIKNLSPADLADQYWQDRQQAELLTNRSGLKDVYFELDSWELTDQAKHSLTLNAEYLKANPRRTVTIEGHCDERGTRAYNYVLGEKRALRVRDYLTRLGVSPYQLTVMSYGKDNPLCRQNSESCFQENRRAHFLLGIEVADVGSWESDEERPD